MFHSHNLKEYTSITNQAAEQLISNLQVAASSGKPVDILQQLGQMTMRVLGVAAFG